MMEDRTGLGLFGRHSHVVVGLDAVAQGYEGKYVNENDFLFILECRNEDILATF